MSSWMRDWSTTHPTRFFVFCCRRFRRPTRFDSERPRPLLGQKGQNANPQNVGSDARELKEVKTDLHRVMLLPAGRGARGERTEASPPTPGAESLGPAARSH